MTLTLYATTAAVFLILDAIMLTLVMKPLFTRHIGPLMAEPIRYVPAGLFYAAYVGGLLYLVSVPALLGTLAGVRVKPVCEITEAHTGALWLTHFLSGQAAQLGQRA